MNGIDSEPRDDRELWDAVAAIPVPAMSEEFRSSLQARLAEESPAAADETRTGDRRLRLMACLVAAGLAVAVTATVVLAGIPGTHSSGPAIANAGQLSTFMGDAWARATTMQGTVVTHELSSGSDQTTTSRASSFATTSQGDYRIATSSAQSTQTPGGGAITNRDEQVRIYNAATNTWFSRSSSRMQSATGATMFEEKPHDSVHTVYWGGTGPRPLVVDQVLPSAAILRAALADADPGLPVEKVSYGGHEAWRAVVTFVSEAGSAYGGQSMKSTYEIVVDAASGLPLHGSSSATVGSRTVDSTEFDVSDLRVDDPIPVDTFSTSAPLGLEPPPDTSTPSPRSFFGTCELGQVAQRVGYAPLVPASIPAGYVLTHVAADPLATHSGPNAWFNSLWGPVVAPDSDAPVSEAGLSYTRGFDTFWIEMAPAAGPGGLSAADLLQTVGRDPGWQRTLRQDTVSGGPFAGATAMTCLDIDYGTQLLVWNHDWVVTIAGNLSRAEALAIVGSLSPYAK